MKLFSSFIFLLFSISFTILIAQEAVEVEGNIKLTDLDFVTESSNVVVQQSDGTLGISSFPSTADVVEEIMPLSFHISWSDYGAGYQEGHFYKHDDRVYLGGLVEKSSTLQAGDVIFTLPLGYRPLAQILATGMQNGQTIRVDIKPNGEVIVMAGFTTAYRYISLEGISFYKETLEIGDQVFGGLLFYLAEPPVDLNNDGIPDRGLIAATEDIDAIGPEWGCFGSELPGARSAGIGTGWQNTLDILASCGEMNIAAKQCADLVVDVYDDWFLPSPQEFAQLSQNIGRDATGDLSNVANLSDLPYWTSSQNSFNYSNQATRDVIAGTNRADKNTKHLVRPIRVF